MTMTETAVRKTVTVDVHVEKAFRVFTDRIGDWWIRRTSHRLGRSRERRHRAEGRRSLVRDRRRRQRVRLGQCARLGSTGPARARLATLQ